MTKCRNVLLMLTVALPLGAQPAPAPGPPAPPAAPAPAAEPATPEFPFEIRTKVRTAPMAQRMPRPPKGGQGDRRYERGQRALDARRWDQALDDFSEVAARGGARVDGALYWKAYTLNKLGRRDEALAAIDQLRKSYPKSGWLDDAKALEIEVRQAAGQKISPESESDEELKLMAINSLVNSDPDRAVPLLEKILKGAQPPKLKEHALFVMAQSGSPRARDLLIQVARGGSNPDLQLKAVHYLGAVMGSKENRQILGEIYASSNDITLKRTILHTFMAGGDRDRLFQAAKNEKVSELRVEAIHLLGANGAQVELWQLYQAEPSVEVKEQILQSMVAGGNTDRLLEVARSEKDTNLRRTAIHSLGAMGNRTGDALASMYASNADPAVRKEIIQALFIQSNAKALIEIARKEKDLELKKDVVQKLSHMRSKEAADYMMELLNK